MYNYYCFYYYFEKYKLLCKICLSKFKLNQNVILVISSEYLSVFVCVLCEVTLRASLEIKFMCSCLPIKRQQMLKTQRVSGHRTYRRNLSKVINPNIAKFNNIIQKILYLCLDSTIQSMFSMSRKSYIPK